MTSVRFAQMRGLAAVGSSLHGPVDVCQERVRDVLVERERDREIRVGRGQLAVPVTLDPWLGHA